MHAEDADTSLHVRRSSTGAPALGLGGRVDAGAVPGGGPAGRAPGSRDSEWLEPDGLGGFASGTVGGIRTRRYHALLLAATEPAPEGGAESAGPLSRTVLVNGFDAWVELTGGETVALTSQRYVPDVVHPDGARHLVDVARDP